MSCAMLKTGMSTFDCPQFCDAYCAEATTEDSKDFGFKISSLYPGLTNAEKKFVDKNPKIAAHAYWLSWRAESICKTKYLVSDTNDESDACRHYMWASLLNSKFGSTVASEILDAHEQNPDEPEVEKSMDLANNRKGVLASTEAIKLNKVSDSDFLNQFLSDLDNGKIIVLKRRAK